MTTRQLSPYLLALRWLLLLMIGLIFVIEGRAQSTVPLGSRRPLVAIWCSTEGNVRHDDSPYLRVAVWEDGRIIFASDPKMWSHDLRAGKLSKAQVAELKQCIAGTKVFQLQENSSLVPDAAMDCMMVNIGNKEQIL